jgi:tetratricopeptide (TPR) repeat protein
MVVRDEEHNLPRCLASVAGAVDEIVAVDAYSQDRTYCILKEHDAQVAFCPWTDFSTARNRALDMATGDWVLVLDADEELPPTSREALRDIVNNAPPEVEGYFITVANLVGPEAHPETNTDLIFRLFRNRPEYRFEGAIHEQILLSILAANNGRQCTAYAEGLTILHHGYTDEEIERKGKKERNLAMFKAHPPAEDDLLQHYQLGIEYARAERWQDAIASLTAACQGVDNRQVYLPKLVRHLVLSLAQAGRNDQALAVARLAVRMFPAYADLWYFGGMLLLERGDLRQAGDWLVRALQTPDQPPQYGSYHGLRGFRTQYQIGRVAEMHGHLEWARQWYEMALQDCPGFADAEKAIRRVEEAAKEDQLADLDDFDLLAVYLRVIASDGPVGVGTEDGKVFRGLTAKAVERII